MNMLLLIDANSLIHRFFHALPPLTTPKGEAIGAIYGVSQVLLKIFREIKPTYMAAAFDRPEPTFREEMFKDYKAHRPPTAQPLIDQIIRCHDTFDKFKVKTFEIPSYEADDIVGTLVEKFRNEPDLQIMIFSGDLDTLQLVEGDKVVVNFLLKGISETKIYNEVAVGERYTGLVPKQLPDYKGLVGDVSDNIPGVDGIGAKTALTLIQKFGSIETLFEDIALVEEKVAKKIRGQKEAALFSKRLATINRSAPLYFDSLDDLRVSAPNFEELKKYFTELGFESLVRRL